MDGAFGFFFPIPNTELYHGLVARGVIRDNDDDFLLTPIFANEARLTPEHNYCDNLSARRLTMWKYRLLLDFYALSFARRPWRAFQILWNALRGKETRKLETYLVDLRRKVGIAIRNRFGRRRRAAPEPASTSS